MVTAEGADRIHDLIHLPQRHTVHQFIQLVEILIDLNVYAKTKEECEIKLASMIEEVKKEIAAEKESVKK